MKRHYQTSSNPYDVKHNPEIEAQENFGMWLFIYIAVTSLLPDVMLGIIQWGTPGLYVTLFRAGILVIGLMLMFFGNHTIRIIMGLLTLLTTVAGIALIVVLLFNNSNPEVYRLFARSSTDIKFILLATVSGVFILNGVNTLILFFSGSLKSFMDR